VRAWLQICMVGLWYGILVSLCVEYDLAPIICIFFGIHWWQKRHIDSTRTLQCSLMKMLRKKLQGILASTSVMVNLLDFFTAWRYTSTVLTVIVCLSVCLSVCLYVHPSVHPSHTSIISKSLNAESCKQCHTIAQDRNFRCQRSRRNSNGVTSNRGAKCR